MNVRNMVKLFASIVMAIQLSLLAACGEPEEATASADHPKLVKTIVLGGAQQGSGISLPGRVDAVDKVELAFQVDGPLIELPIVEGQRVKQGDLLARIDPRDYENFLDAAKAKLSEAQRQYERYAALIKTRTSPVSKAEVDEKKGRLRNRPVHYRSSPKRSQ
jgi:multidrug efflux pump subunit AcrA (membrane-fusion protein)